MDDYDRNNLEFLLKATPEALEEWSKEVTQDDLDYAQELLDAYQLELNERALALNLVSASDDKFEEAIIAAEARGSVYYEFEEYLVH
jgi:hypothetical protein